MMLKRFVFSRKMIYFIIWAGAFKLAIKIEFGTVYTIFSLILFIFLNLGKREEGTLSAYSIFNDNYEKLIGEFDSNSVGSMFG